MTTRRRAALRGLARLRVSLKRAHNICNILREGFDALMYRVRELEAEQDRQERERAEVLEAEVTYLLDAGERRLLVT